MSFRTCRFAILSVSFFSAAFASFMIFAETFSCYPPLPFSPTADIEESPLEFFSVFVYSFQTLLNTALLLPIFVSDDFFQLSLSK